MTASTSETQNGQHSALVAQRRQHLFRKQVLSWVRVPSRALCGHNSVARILLCQSKCRGFESRCPLSLVLSVVSQENIWPDTSRSYPCQGINGNLFHTNAVVSQLAEDFVSDTKSWGFESLRRHSTIDLGGSPSGHGACPTHKY